MIPTTIGIIGGGDIAAMIARSAIALGVDVRILTSREGDPACSVSERVTIGNPEDPATIERFSRGCDVLTFEHQRVDPGVVAALEARGRIVRSGSKAWQVADKARQRRRLHAFGLPVPPFAVVDEVGQISAFAAEHGWPVVATPTSGRDVAGVVRILHGEAEAHDLLAGSDAAFVVEPHLPLHGELCVIVARRPRGDVAAYPVVDTILTDDGRCETIAPTAVGAERAAEATHLAVRIAAAIGAFGVLAVEFFDTPTGLVIDQLVPRPHADGNWTVLGSVTSQFENHVRGILDWPLGDTSMRAPSSPMVGSPWLVSGDAR